MFIMMVTEYFNKKKSLMRNTVFLLITLAALNAHADELTDIKKERILKSQDYEPSTVGITYDNNDVRYLDFKLSQIYPIYPIFHDEFFKSRSFLPSPYFAFTGRFGQYIGTRNSAPVIGKQFNPKFFGRYWLNNKKSYIDFGYNHESNGQSITTKESLDNLKNEFKKNNEEPNFANDYISRGWDYLNITWKYSGKTNNLSTYLILKYFLIDTSLIQGEAEEFRLWEGGTEGKPRKSIDGITFMIKRSTDFNLKWFHTHKLALIYTTGYKDKDVFKFNTFRVEGTFNVFNSPTMIWYSNGYNSDLVDYYKRIISFGVSFEIRNYLEQI